MGGGKRLSHEEEVKLGIAISDIVEEIEEDFNKKSNPKKKDRIKKEKNNGA